MSTPITLTGDPYLALLTPPSATAPIADRARFALHYAMLAPSVHNTQPWQLKVTEPGDRVTIDVYADVGRELPALDPYHRQLIISCGAMIAALRAGLLRLGLSPTVTLLPRHGVPRLLARVDVRDADPGDPGGDPAGGADAEQRRRTGDLGVLADQLRTRRTYRGPMTADPVSAGEKAALAEAAAIEGAALTWIDDPVDRHVVERLVAVATLIEARTGGIDEEVRLWTSRDPRSRDGIPPESWQRTSIAAVGAPVVQRDFALGRRVLQSDAIRTEAPAALAVLSTGSDTPHDWLRTGQALLRILLRAGAAGLAVGFVNQPTEVAEIRKSLAAHLAHALPAADQTPHLVLRVGHPAWQPPPATPRRPAARTVRS